MSVVDFSGWEANENVHILIINVVKITVDYEMFGKTVVILYICIKSW